MTKPNKKQKTTSASPSFSSIPNASLLYKNLFKNKDEVALCYATAQPFPHGCLPTLLSPNTLETILSELKNNLKATFKESDLFKFYQTLDVGNLTPETNSELCTKMPTLIKMKECLYSEPFRAYIEDLASLPRGTLINKVDCAVNVHANGCHLLCHDDVIGTRKISFIIYLTDPEPEWTTEDGGHLELYPLASDGVNPAAIPSKNILPKFNQLAFFEVRPGKSFHSVQEVYNGERPRMSIQGWFHAREKPGNFEMASLERLKSGKKGEDTEGDFDEGFYPSGEEVGDVKEVKEVKKGENGERKKIENCLLSKSDRQYLKEYVNPTYLNMESITQIRER